MESEVARAGAAARIAPLDESIVVRLQRIVGARSGAAEAEVRGHLDSLSDAIGAARSDLFIDHVRWVQVMRSARGAPSGELETQLARIRDACRRVLDDNAGAIAVDCVDRALADLPRAPVEVATFLDEAAPHAALARRYLDRLLAGERHEAGRIVLEAVERGMAARDVYLHVFEPALREVGRLWQLDRITVAHEHYCTAATQLVMSLLYPRLFGARRRGARLVAACVSGSLHEIGVRMVADLFELDGWDTQYLGADTPTPAVLDLVAERGADLLLVSASLSRHVGRVAALIAEARRDPRCRGVGILVGGHIFNAVDDLWSDVRADGFARDAAEAVDVGAGLLARRGRP